MYYDGFYHKNHNYLIVACFLKAFKILLNSSKEKYFGIFDPKKGTLKYQEIKSKVINTF
jgi:hypothetical protein